ncbi:receptor-type tyrosine-protein phosphatase epsilon-like [Lingula anatina]|uniref:protein-tyrosine-phosphatase n=1 Tax=Lingula anatina TaxID=7574 RepID=A0A1S3IKW3_LINAN|nr:receptor-type tyrosine-protein phosphatase epsilon-like [Lingula anatina]|eukprot:XP_013398159.1 receptor-type tyrosine-protein phosphatase epsilon-like [Lingula anatina]
MAALPRITCFLVVWMIFLTVHLCLCCMEGDGYFGWQCDTVTGCFCKQGQRCQRTLRTCPEQCVDNPWGIGCQDENINLAYGKQATQSSTYMNVSENVSYPANLAVDGHNSTDDLKCIKTNSQNNPTWSVDLGGLYVIRRVALIKPDICQFQGVQLCINNKTASDTGCRAVGVDNTQCSTSVLEYEIDSPILGRYVTLRKSGTQIFRLCEIVVRGYTYPYNVAIGRTAEQSDVAVIAGGVPSRTVDGNVNADFNAGSCSHTDLTPYPWWRVDLGQQYVVYSVTLFNRGVGVDSGKHLKNLSVKTRNITDTSSKDVCATYVPQVPRGGSVELSCQVPHIGQVVIVQLEHEAPLILCEVTIKGYRYKETVVTVEIPMNSVIPCMESVHLAVLKAGRDIMEHVKWGMNQEVHRCDGFGKLTVRYEGEFNNGTTDVLHVNETQLITITNLTTYSKYTIYLTAVNNLHLVGPPVTVTHTTAEGVPPKMKAPNVTSTGYSSIEITWRAPSPPGGVIVSYQISYFQQPGQWEETVTGADITSKIIGNLQFNSTYMIRIRAKTAVGYGEYSDLIRATTSMEKDVSIQNELYSINGGAVSGGVLGVLVLVAVVVVVVVIYKRRQRRNESNGIDAFSELQGKEASDELVEELPRENMYENADDEHLYGNIDQSTEIPVEDIFEVMKLKTRDVLKAEYQKFPTIFIWPCEAGQKRENKLKNRFQNIMPYDHSRVVLDLLQGDPNSDYVNANYIDGYKRPRAFIASQGPKPNTVKDFWRMIWQVKSPQIVMVTKTVEMGKQKCEQYWADEGVKQFGEIEVTTLDEIQGQDYFVRNLKYCKVGELEVRTVKQFHFTGWPDHGVPVDPTALVKFREEVKKYQSQVQDQGPIIVHCSAGVGRTGTFIALDYLFEQVLAEGKIDIYRLIQEMRASRPKMVQTVEQYYFIHDVMLEELHCGLTSIPVQDFATRLRKLRRRNKSGLTKMEEEFVILNLMLPEIDESSIKTALEPINIDKNRVRNIVAGNHCRPYLVSYVKDSTDYINAVFIDGYQRQDAYIVTQMPLPHTVVDFWSMLYDQHCATIVMLNEANEESKTSAVYWPVEEPTTYGHFTVEVISMHQIGESITIRELKLVSSKRHSAPPRTVCQFQFHEWGTSEPVPPSPRAFLELFDAVQQWQQKSGNTSITVHCMNGAHQSGLFCAVARILDKLKVEQEVDVFHTVKAVRQNRPQLIDSKEQYYFCYEVVEEYAHRFDTYANFQM